MYFGSDNQTGASDQVFSYLQKANHGITGAYSDDEWTQQAVEAIQECFECQAKVFFVSTGTAANSLALASMSQPWDSIVCHGQAHIINDELTAPEFFTSGARLIGLDTRKPTLTLETFTHFLAQGATHPPHNAVPTALSITQQNESGQIYSIEELSKLCDVAHQHGLTVQMDGARFANAVAALNCSPADISWRAGVDVLCLGATKNGALGAEAVIFFNEDLAKQFVQHRKRSGHLVSKSRWMGAQFLGWLANNHWLELATHANTMAAKLRDVLRVSDKTRIAWSTHGNEVFVIMPKSTIATLRENGAIFYEWPRNFLPEDMPISIEEDIVRLVTSFKTTSDEIEQLASFL